MRFAHSGHAVDYLLKPFGAGQLSEALAHARVRLAGRESGPVAELGAAARPHGGPIERVLIPRWHNVRGRIPENRVNAEAQDDYVGPCIAATERAI